MRIRTFLTASAVALTLFLQTTTWQTTAFASPPYSKLPGAVKVALHQKVAAGWKLLATACDLESYEVNNIDGSQHSVQDKASALFSHLENRGSVFTCDYLIERLRGIGRNDVAIWLAEKVSEMSTPGSAAPTEAQLLAQLSQNPSLLTLIGDRLNKELSYFGPAGLATKYGVQIAQFNVNNPGRKIEGFIRENTTKPSDILMDAYKKDILGFFFAALKSEALRVHGVLLAEIAKYPAAPQNLESNSNVIAVARASDPVIATSAGARAQSEATRTLSPSSCEILSPADFDGFIERTSGSMKVALDLLGGRLLPRGRDACYFHFILESLNMDPSFTFDSLVTSWNLKTLPKFSLTWADYKYDRKSSLRFNSPVAAIAFLIEKRLEVLEKMKSEKTDIGNKETPLAILADLKEYVGTHPLSKTIKTLMDRYESEKNKTIRGATDSNERDEGIIKFVDDNFQDFIQDDELIENLRNFLLGYKAFSPKGMDKSDVKDLNTAFEKAFDEAPTKFTKKAKAAFKVLIKT